MTLGEQVRKSFLTSAIALGTACGGNGGVTPPPNPPPPPSNKAPSANLIVSPTSGSAPLDVRVQVGGSDSDGSVVLYEADLNGDGDYNDAGESQASPIDTQVNLGEGTHTIRGRVRDNDGAFSSIKTQQIAIQASPSLSSGQLQDNETDLGRRGTIKIYDASNNNFITKVQTDDNGNFPETQLPVTANEYIVQAAIFESGQQNSYVVTRRISANSSGGIDIPLISVIPYDGMSQAGISIDDFISHVGEVSHSDGLLRRWDVSNLPIVYIAETNPEPRSDGTSKGAFTDADQEEIKAKWENPNDIPLCYGDNVLEVIKGKDNDTNPPYTIDTNGFLIPNENTIVIVNDTTISGSGFGGPGDNNGDGLYETAKIRINKKRAKNRGQQNYEHTISHEACHAGGARNHAQTLNPSQTIMIAGESNSFSPTPLQSDTKFSKIIYEQNYLPNSTIQENLTKNFLPEN